MSRESRTVAALFDASEVIDRCLAALPAAYAVSYAETSTYHLRSANYDGARPGSDHADPVGQHVASGVERYEADTKAIEEVVRAIAREAERLTVLLVPFETRGHRLTTPLPELAVEAKEAALEEARVARENESVELCWSCLRIGVRVKYLHARVVDGDSRKLCRFCYEEHRSTGSLPSREDLEGYHSPDGKRRRRVTPGAGGSTHYS